MTDSPMSASTVLDPLALSRAISESYHNRSLGQVNDHEIRMSVMTQQFQWHHHPNSDETFFCVDGELVVEFADGQVIVRPGQFVTVPAGTVHRTRPLGARSANLTIERVSTQTCFDE